MAGRQVSMVPRALAALALAVLAACSGGGEQDGTATPPPELSATPPTAAQVQAEWAAYQALDREQALARAVAAQAPAWRQAADWSGLTATLGGAAATDAALQASAATARTYLDGPGLAQREALLASLGIPTGAQPAQAAAERRRPLAASGDSSGVMGLALSYFSAGLVNKFAANAKFNEAVKGGSSSTEGGHGLDMNLDVARDHLRYGDTMNTVDNKLGLRVQNSTTLDTDFCPDANGRMTLKLGTDARFSAVNDDSTGTHTQIDVTVVRQLDDDARLLAPYSVEVRVQQAAFAAARGTFVDVTYTRGADGVAGATVNRASSAATAAHVEATSPVALSAVVFGLLMSTDMETAAQSGRCVTLTADTTPAVRTNLAPSAPVQIVASPRSAVDGTFTPATVKATLTGGTAITPAQAAADATFAYTAPAAPGQAATVALESRSRRGVGKATLAFSTGEVVQRYQGSMSAQSGIAGALVTTTQIDQITWTYKQGSPQEALVYEPSGTARVTLSMAGCSVTRTLAIDPATSHLTVFGPDERPDGRQKAYFAQVNTAKVQATLSCAAFPQPVAVELQGVFRNGCDSDVMPDAGMPRYTDIHTLSGTRAVGVPCNLVGADAHSWSLQAVVE